MERNLLLRRAPSCGPVLRWANGPLEQDRQGRQRRPVLRGPGGAPEALVWSRRLGGLIRADFHVHTTYSACADPAAAPEAMVQAAQEAGLEAVGITDHIVSPINFDRPWRVRQELPELGHEVTVCPDGLTAAAALQKNTYDCILVDLDMPGLGGIEVIARAKQIAPETEATP